MDSSCVSESSCFSASASLDNSVDSVTASETESMEISADTSVATWFVVEIFWATVGLTGLGATCPLGETSRPCPWVTGTGCPPGGVKSTVDSVTSS